MTSHLSVGEDSFKDTSNIVAHDQHHLIRCHATLEKSIGDVDETGGVKRREDSAVEIAAREASKLQAHCSGVQMDKERGK